MREREIERERVREREGEFIQDVIFDYYSFIVKIFGDQSSGQDVVLFFFGYVVFNIDSRSYEEKVEFMRKVRQKRRSFKVSFDMIFIWILR